MNLKNGGTREKVRVRETGCIGNNWIDLRPDREREGITRMKTDRPKRYMYDIYCICYNDDDNDNEDRNDNNDNNDNNDDRKDNDNDDDSNRKCCSAE